MDAINTHIRLATALTKLLDSQFKFLNFRFGLDPLIGLIPGIGDIITFLLSFYLVWIGMQMKLPEKEIETMIRNVVFDFILGLIPVIGDIGDFVFKANAKNLKILKRYQYSSVIEGIII